nr:MAG TPA: Chromatin remodeling complex ATPase [Caudoviricetes sp.]
MNYVLRDYQQKASDAAVSFFNNKAKKTNAIMVLPTGCHAKGSKILMYDGSIKNVEDVIIGDELVGDDGNKRTVLELHRGVDKLYEITPIKGEPFVVNGGHILSLYKTNEGKSYPSCTSRIDEITVEDYLSTSNNYKHLHKLYKPKSVSFGRNDVLPIDPYFLGLYLGDGSSACGGVNITSMRKEVEEYLYSFVKENELSITENWKGGSNKAKTYNIVGLKWRTNTIIDFLKDRNLYGVTCSFKFIPLEYKAASEKDRLSLLAGLMDTDSHYAKDRNEYEYCTKSGQLADDIIFLCRSLGFYCSTKKQKIVNGEVYYRLIITGELDTIPTKVQIRKGKPRAQKKSVLVTGFSVKYLGRGNYYGFTIDGNHLYCDGQFFVHHNSGKSLIIADIAARLDGHILVFQPSKEILEQNFKKLCSYGILDCSIYSASFNSKEISRITFATIGSVKGHPELFSHFKNIIIDECHLVNPKEGMYKDFLSILNCKVLGLTATPYRLSSSQDFGAMLKFITRTRPAIFKEVIYHVQVSTLLDMGYLAKLNYYSMNPIGWNEFNLKTNTTGADYTDKSVQREYERIDFYGYLVHIVQRLMNPIQGGKRKGILVFTRFLKEAERLTMSIPGCAIVSGDTPKSTREMILKQFKTGEIPVVANVGVLTTGFDYPELDTIVMARPTMSLAMYYQIVGRAIRPHPSKECGWFVDLCGNIKRFGEVSDLRLVDGGNGKWAVFSKGRQLTNVRF